MKNNDANENLMISDNEHQTEITTKNKWLYPTDGFGILEKGVEFDSKTYHGMKKEMTLMISL